MDLLQIVLGLISVILIFGVVSYFQVANRIQKWREDIQRMEYHSDDPSAYTPWIGEMINEYKKFSSETMIQLNTQALVEKHLSMQKIRLFGLINVPLANALKLLQQLPPTSIIIGILGTFVGLTNSLFSMQETLLMLGSTSGDVTINTIIQSISAPFQGMSFAFLTSIAGIGTSLVLSILQSGFLNGGRSIQYLQMTFISEAESLLDHHVASIIEMGKPKDTYEKILDRLANKVHDSFQSSIGRFSEEMIGFTKQLDESMNDVKKILESQRQFSESFASNAEKLNDFGKALAYGGKTLTAFQDEIKKQIQQLNGGFHKFGEDIKLSIEKQEQGNRSFTQLIERSDRVIQDTTKKTEELSGGLLRGVEQITQRFGERQEELERRLAQKNDEWNYRYQEKQDQYSQASQDFSYSVQQMEKAWHETVERIRREIIEKLERDMQQRNRPQGQEPIKEVIRYLEMNSDRHGRDLRELQQTLNEIYQLIYRGHELQVHQARRNRDGSSRKTIETGLTD